ncbi:Xaa-Pro peptidase family protein [Dethiobacter alkaliphilus]|nr:Xaa-Pro peptidase family protein [Dethiobacter alkaliphilus]MCW3490284.1 Xaa-Pro peptidase family protein [Dethiobacter alkaliphilus]
MGKAEMLKRVDNLRERLAEDEIAALLVTNPVNIAYLSGFTGTSGYLLVTPQKAYLLTDFRYLEQARAQSASFTIVDVAGAPWKQVSSLLAKDKLGELVVEGDHLTVDVFDKLTAQLEGVTTKALPSPVNGLRSVKDKSEQEAIAAAVSLTDEAFTHILPFIRPGVREAEVALELEFFLRKNGASGPSFSFIVASGTRSALPHGVAGDKLLETGDAVVLDFGCVLDGYCSDMSRTVFVGSATERQKDVYYRVLEAQQSALEQLRPGMNGTEADALARNVLAKYDLTEKFGHGLGHGLGRVIHEAPRLSPVSEDVLKPGMVVTVEPGVYISGEFGVRIEDVVVITEDGVVNLTKSSKDLVCI